MPSWGNTVGTSREAASVGEVGALTAPASGAGLSALMSRAVM